MTTHVLLAAGPGDILPVIFVLIAIASGIINFVKERRAAEQARPRRDVEGGEAKDPELQSEIDAFLNEVSGSEGAKSQTGRPGGSDDQSRQRHLSQEEEERRRRIRARRERERRQKQAAQEARENEAARKRQTLAEHHLANDEIGEISHRHVQSSVQARHLAPHIHEFDEFDEAERPTGSAQSGYAAAGEAEPLLLEERGSRRVAGQAGSGTPLEDILNRPIGMQTAIMLNEIMSPPVSRRRR